MEKKEIIIPKTVDTYLKKLTTELHRKGYFNYLEAAEIYVNDLINEMRNDLFIGLYHETPQELKKYGNYYVKIQGSKRTTWYIFFDTNRNRYIIEFVTNNHMPESGYFNNL